MAALAARLADGHMTTPLTSTETDSPRQPPPVGRAGKYALLGVAAVAAVVLLFALAVVGFRIARPGALPGLELSGVELGGLRSDALRAVIADVAADRAAIEITAVRDDEQVTATAADIGYRLDVDRTVVAVLDRGRQANPIAALADHIRAFSGTIPIEPVQTIDAAQLDTWVTMTADELSLASVAGGVWFEGATVLREDPQPGARVLVDPLRAAARDAVFRGYPTTIRVVTEPVSAELDRSEVDAAFAAAIAAVSAPVRLFRQDASYTFTPEELGTILRVVRGGAGEPTLKLDADPGATAEVLTPQERAPFESDPVDARFTVAGPTVLISESAAGLRFDPALTAEQVLALATGDGPREAAFVLEVVEPDLSSEEARGLNIVEQVSTFTTNHPCCQSRVQNIHRIADLVDGAVIRPGETFSLNGHVGDRTAAKGFVPGGAIQDGEFVDEIGGGVSQFTTTMFNAAYFGGYGIVEHKPHSYYISRYPEGREATLNFPTVDLRIRNTSPHGILVQTSYTDTSITVSFYGKRWVTVESITGPRTNPRSSETEYRENPELPVGDERVVQEGGTPGFDVTVTRILRFPNGEVKQEEYRTTYLAEPTIIEQNTR